MSPEKQIQYTIDLTGEYHNFLEKEENNRAQTFLWDGNVAGTYFAQAREYSALLGRFYEEDLVKGNIILPNTQNLYKYALNQPLRYIDPTGLLEECIEEEENELRIAREKYCEQIVENVSESVNWALWTIDGAFSGIEVYNQISKHIPRFITNSNNRNLVNIADSVNYNGGRGGIRRISKSNLLAKNDELGRAYRTNRNLNRISKGLIVLNAGVVRAKWFENGSKSVMDYAKQGANWAVDKVSEGLNSIGEVFSGIGDLVFG